MLEKEFQYYIDNQSELVKKYNGKFLVIKDCTVKNNFSLLEEALTWASKNFDLGTFIVQQCTEGDEAYTQTFHSRVIFA